MRHTEIGTALLVAVCAATVAVAARPYAQTPGAAFSFAVSGDSRDCGDVVMPAIAASVLKRQAQFYWHLGDFRKTYDFDEDMQNQLARAKVAMTIVDYENQSWSDAIDNQIGAFGTLPFYAGIGNHETYWPKTREMFLLQFADWLNSPVLRQQRLADDPRDHMLRAYYHWVQGPVDFIYLDNSTADQFDFAQIGWLFGVLARDRANPNIKSIVVGMHEALPESISADHSMNESLAGIDSGRQVYRQLLDLQNTAKKNVYVLASHSHFYMDGIFNTPFWRTHGGVLPGWIVGTAGAPRYALPQNWSDAKHAETNIYGYLVGTVGGDGSVAFSFQHITENDVPTATAARYKPEFVRWCFAENRL